MPMEYGNLLTTFILAFKTHSCMRYASSWGERLLFSLGPKTILEKTDFWTKKVLANFFCKLFLLP